MTIKQGTNDANIITCALISAMGVVASSIIIVWRSIRSVIVGLHRSSIKVPWWRVVVILPRIEVVVTLSVPVVAPASLRLGIVTSTSLVGLGIMTSTSLMGFALILFVRVYDFFCYLHCRVHTLKVHVEG